MKPKAVVLLSGGLDSAVTLYSAINDGYECHCLSFDYGQRHRQELRCARQIARKAGVTLHVVKLRMPWKGSSLLDTTKKLPLGRSVKTIKRGGIPSTYVPGRNTIFLSLAASFAEAIGARAIFIGAHAEDSSGYPDCRAGYLKAFDHVVRIGTKRGLEGKLRLKFPLIKMGKSRIIKFGSALGVPFGLTRSCYSNGGTPCGTCDSCVLRAKGFREAGLKDPVYA